MTKTEIEQSYLALHDALGTQKDAPDKDLFDQQHRQVWADCDVELKQRKAELEDMELLDDEERGELDELTTIYPPPPPPGRDLGAEIDTLKIEIGRLREK